MKNTSKQRGFTLVEIAIVLVIIGLIIGGVIRGQALIQQARVKNAINQIDSFRAAVFGFQDRFGFLPGDETLAGIPLNDAGNGNGNGIIENIAGEATEVWNDLSLTEFISHEYDGAGADSIPRNPFGGQVNLFAMVPAGGVGLADRMRFQMTQIPWDAALEIDQRHDDGAATTGSIRGSAEFDGTTQTLDITIDF